MIGCGKFSFPHPISFSAVWLLFMHDEIVVVHDEQLGSLVI